MQKRSISQLFFHDKLHTDKNTRMHKSCIRVHVHCRNLLETLLPLLHHQLDRSRVWRKSFMKYSRHQVQGVEGEFAPSSSRNEPSIFIYLPPQLAMLDFDTAVASFNLSFIFPRGEEQQKPLYTDTDYSCLLSIFRIEFANSLTRG